MVVFWMLVMGQQTAFAQQKKALDSILKIGFLQVYDKPDEAIKMGKYVANTTTNIRQKTNGLMLVSDAFASKRDYQKSLEYVIKAKTAAAASDDKLIEIKILTKTAILYQQLRIYDKAIQHLDESTLLAKSYPDKDSIRVLLGNCYVIRGFIYKEQLNCDIAISYFKQGISEYLQSKTTFVYANLSIVNYNIGNCYILINDNEAAKKSFYESINYAKKVSANSLLAFAQKGLAEVFTLEGKYQEAIVVLTEAEKTSENVGDLILNQGIYKGLSENYLAISNWEKHHEFHQKYLKTILKTKESERKSIGDSLIESAKIQHAKLQEIKKWYVTGIFILVSASILSLILIFLMQKKASKKLQQLKQKAQKFQKKTDSF